MQSGRHVYQSVFSTARIAMLGSLIGLFTVPAGSVLAMESLDDAAMAEVSGAGIALGFEDFRWLTKPTSYFEQVGSDPVGDTTLKRADMRWYGVNISGAGAGGSHWDESTGNFGTPCDASGLSCPRGGTIDHFSPYDNPYLLRAYSPEGFSYDGTPINGTSGNNKTIYEFLAPTQQPDYTMSFWGEIEAGAIRNSATQPLSYGQGVDNDGGLLKSQTIIRGNAANSEFRLFQFTKPEDETFAIMYHSYLQGDFRFSVAQHDGTESDEIGVPVRFDASEGLHFKNVEAFIPLGQLFYQAMILDATPEQNGNFILEIPRLRDHDAPGYNAADPLNDAIRHFYSYAVDENLPDAGFISARLAYLHNTEGANVQAYKNHVENEYGVQVNDTPEWLAQYNTTHGYSRWGDWYPCRGIGCPAIHSGSQSHPDRNTYNDTSDGVFFRKCDGCDDFEAMAYMITAADVRIGENEYSCPGGAGCGDYQPRGIASSSRNDNGRYYVASDSCSPGSGSAAYRCGYGGGYSINANGYGYSDKQDPSELFGVSSRAPSQGVPVIRTDAVNLGDSRIEGLQVNYMKFTSYGAGAP